MDKKSEEKIIFDASSSISVRNDATPETYPLHWHDAAEFTLILKNGCRYRVNDTLFELSKGDVLLIWPQQLHETVKIPRGGATFLQFSGNFLENNLDLISVSGFLHAFNVISHKEEPELAEYISERITEIQEIHSSSDFFKETKSKLCIYDMLLKIGEHVMSKRKNTGDTGPNTNAGWGYIRAACNYIAENASDDITQTEVASHVGLSSFYFSKLFGQYMHMSFPAYLADIRVKNAVTLLLDKNLSVTECAFQSGFQSTTTFNKVFREITGYSPRDYRKLYR